MKKRTAVLLINIGTPDSPSPSDVGRYLQSFLKDPRVIDLPQPWRFLLVNGIIIPFRKYSSAKKYRSIWTEKGSPLLFITRSFAEKLQTFLNRQNFPGDIFWGMRYGNPSLKKVLNDLLPSYHDILCIPLYPHYASSTTASTLQHISDTLSRRQVIPSVRFMDFFFHQTFFLDCYAEKIRSFRPEQYDAVIFSYHGLPLRQIRKCAQENNYSCLSSNCCSAWNKNNFYCYRAQCEETTRQLARRCNLSPEVCYTTFQSRLSEKWLEPFTDKTLQNLAQKGKKKILIVSPSFVTDCLETIEEIGVECRNIFLDAGGEIFDRVPCLNDDENWIQEMGNYLIRTLS